MTGPAFQGKGLGGIAEELLRQSEGGVYETPANLQKPTKGIIQISRDGDSLLIVGKITDGSERFKITVGPYGKMDVISDYDKYKGSEFLEKIRTKLEKRLFQGLIKPQSVLPLESLSPPTPASEFKIETTWSEAKSGPEAYNKLKDVLSGCAEILRTVRLDQTRNTVVTVKKSGDNIEVYYPQSEGQRDGRGNRVFTIKMNGDLSCKLDDFAVKPVQLVDQAEVLPLLNKLMANWNEGRTLRSI